MEEEAEITINLKELRKRMANGDDVIFEMRRTFNDIIDELEELLKGDKNVQKYIIGCGLEEWKTK